jgi:hypothetical protein
MTYRPLFFKLQWIVIPIIIVTAVEFGLRKSDMARPLWYSRAEIIAAQGNVDFVFIGSSKVAAAFIEDTFNRRMSAVLGRKVVSINLGQGYSSSQYHYLGLRNLIREYPESFKKVTLFIESHCGTPIYQYHSDWESRWLTKQPQLLVPLLRCSDIGPFWKTRGTKTGEKLFVIFKYLSTRSYIIRYRERARQKFEQEGQAFIDRFVRWLFHLPSPLPAVKHTLRGIGGIKTNTADLEKIRKFGITYYAGLSKRRRILKWWDKSVLANIIELVKQQEGEVFFVDLPACSLEREAYRSETHEANKRIIKKYLAKWEASFLVPDFDYTDNDIPDYFHLRFSRAAEFTEKLAAAYIEKKRKKE